MFAEIERAAKLPGIRGYYIATQVLGKNLSDEAFLPVYERIESTGLPLFLHPVEVIGAERVDRDEEDDRRGPGPAGRRAIGRAGGEERQRCARGGDEPHSA